MNIRCQSCHTLFRVDPDKVPVDGVRARCTVCAHIFFVSRDGKEEIDHRRSAAQDRVANALGDAYIAPPGGRGHGHEASEPHPPVVAPVASKATTPTPQAAPEPDRSESDHLFSTAPRPSWGAMTPPVEEPDVADPADAEDNATLERPSDEATPFEREKMATPEPRLPSTQAPPPVEPPVASPTPSAPVFASRAPAVGPVGAPKPPAMPPRTSQDGFRGSRPFTPGAPPKSSAPSGPAEPMRPTAPVFRPTPGAPVRPAPAPSTPKPSSAPERPINPFLSRDPSQKARRLARALVSDIIVYQPDKRQKALREGNLKEAFEDEIKKSWEEFVDQVGEDVARSSNHFNEALNDILADGQAIF